MSKPITLHTLKTLYIWANRQYPALVARLPRLEDYCLNDSKKHPPYTLGWLIYALRARVSQEDLRGIFYYSLVESLFWGESFLYSDMRKFYVVYAYRKVIAEANQQKCTTRK